MLGVLVAPNHMREIRLGSQLQHGKQGNEQQQVEGRCFALSGGKQTVKQLSMCCQEAGLQLAPFQFCV